MTDFAPMAKCALLAGVAMMMPLPMMAAHAGQAAAASAADAAASVGTGQINGTVADANGNLVAGATVRIEGSNIVETTDPGGRFSFRSAPAGQQRITVRYFGADPVTQTVNVAAGQTASIAISVGGRTSEDGEIVVTVSRPIAESEAAALQLQRSSTALVNVLAADSIGRFPDQNLAASLGRLPGVGIQRDQGQDRFISIRGSRNSWTTVSFDGINVVSPSGRTTRFDTIPSAIASKVIVRKAVTADLTGETVAGNVDVQTRSAFDYPGFKLALDLGAGFSELGGGRQYNVNGHISNRFFNDTVGILLSASRFEVDMITDNYESRFERAPEDQEPGFEDRIWTSSFDNRYYRLTRSNQSFTGRLDWRPDDNNEIFISSVWTQFRDREERQQYLFDFDDGATRTSAATPALGARTGYADIRTGNTPQRGTLFGAEIDAAWGTSNSPQTIFTTTLGGNHTLGEWKVGWRGNFTRGDDDRLPQFASNWRSPRAAALRPSIVYDFTNERDPLINLFETVVDADGNRSLGSARNFISPGELEFVQFRRDIRRARTDAYTARLDVDRNFNIFGNDTKLQFGAQYNDRVKTATRFRRQIRPGELSAAGIPLPSQADFIDRSPVKTGLPQNFTFFQLDTPTTNALVNSYLDAGAFSIDQNEADNNGFRVTEKVIAGYMMGTMFFDSGNVVAGVRAERYENTGTALSTIGGQRVPVTVTSAQTLFFPSLHVNYDATDEIKLRLSVNTGAARADYGLLRPNFSVDDLEEIVSGGNPFAVPEKAIGVDGYVEWYMANRGFFSVGVYYKKIRDVLFNSSLPRFGNDVLNEPGFDRAEYQFNTTLNGGSGTLKGVEIAYSQPFASILERIGAPEWSHGFGFQGNITFNESDAITPQGRKVQLPDTSKLLYNASLYYEQYGLSLRASWQYRNEWLNSINSGPIGDRFWGSVGRLDLSARYAVNPRMELFFDANNLLDAPGTRYDGIPSRLYEFEQFGARFMGGARFNF